MKIFIFVDDERGDMFQSKASSFIKKYPDAKVYWAKTYYEATLILDTFKDTKCEIYLALDHDLGEEKSGYDVAKYVVENKIPIEKVTIHTGNSVGRKNIYELMTHYGYKCYMQLL